MPRPRLVLTAGDPAGIGPEIIAAALADPEIRATADVLVLAPPRAMDATTKASRRAGQPTADFSLLPFGDGANRTYDFPLPPFGTASASEAESRKSKVESPITIHPRANADSPPLPAWAITEAAGWTAAWKAFLQRNGNAAAGEAPVPLAYPTRWLNLPYRIGSWDESSGRASADAVALAVALCGDAGGDWADAIVTGPITKAAWDAAGVRFPGHTEYLAALSGATGREVMLLVGGGLRVALATVHEPLRRVPDLLTTGGIVTTGQTVAAALARDFGLARARLAVLGLNPHAGEEGRLGDEEIRIIAPAVARLRAAGVDAVGPLPADSAFHHARAGAYDAVLAMYHDQGLGPLKTVGFEDGVNVTLGLPIIRTSVDHGTAFDLAGTGRASPRSLCAAIQLAVEIARHRLKTENQNSV